MKLSESVPDGQSSPTMKTVVRIDKLSIGLPVEGQVDGCIPEFIIKTQHTIDTYRCASTMFIIIKPNMCARANIPFKARSSADIAMYLEQPGYSESVFPKISKAFQCIL